MEKEYRRMGGRLENVDPTERLDAYLSKKYKFHNRPTWKERILSGGILIEQMAPQHPEESAYTPVLLSVKPTYKMRSFDQVWFLQPKEEEPIFDKPIPILWDDGDFCVFSKPPSLVVHAAGIYAKQTFLYAIEKMGYGSCSPVHRIDRETSGILCCARQSSTRNLLSYAFRSSLMQKMYLAVTKGTAEVEDSFCVNSPIGEPENSKIRLKLWVDGKNAQSAQTQFVRLSRWNDFSLFACFPKTGRTNQIRIHLASIGHWIVGDKMYHDNEDVFLEFYEKGMTSWVIEQTLFERHMLHNAGIMAPELGFSPLSTPLVCPLPEDMMASDIVRNLLKLAHIGLDKESQILFLKDMLNKNFI